MQKLPSLHKKKREERKLAKEKDSECKDVTHEIDLLCVNIPIICFYMISYSLFIVLMSVSSYQERSSIFSVIPVAFLLMHGPHPHYYASVK